MNTTLPNWNELLEQVMGGTQGNPSPQGEFAGLTAEAMLLKQLALADVARRAGYMLENVPIEQDENPAPDEILPVCSAKALACLHTMMRVTGGEALTLEWFSIIASKGKRLPHINVRLSLHWSNLYPHWSPFIARVIGERGRWLVQRSDKYPHLKQVGLWGDDELPPLEVPIIPAEAKKLHELRQQLLEDLKDE